MSMNLHSDAVDLWQTPTWITYLAMYDADKRQRPVNETTHIYCEWVQSQLNGAWDSCEQLDAERSRVNYHLQEVRSVPPHELEYYIL
jgi:hypothetical protein